LAKNVKRGELSPENDLSAYSYVFLETNLRKFTNLSYDQPVHAAHYNAPYM